MTENPFPELIDGLPNICGQEERLKEAMAPSPAPSSDKIDFPHIKSAYAIALHMHQPLIPAGSDDLHTAPIISNLKYMTDHPNDGDNHNAAVFHWCYKRMGEFIPQLVQDGKRPRIMFDYSGSLLYGLRQMGLGDVLDALRLITCDPRYSACVEWLGTAWGHAVAPSTPVQDFRLHVRAWQHHFAGIFGTEALQRVRGFSPPEMALPNHPDVAYEFVKTLKDCGFRWVMVQEHTVEVPGGGGQGGPTRQPHIPHRLIARNSAGQSVSIIAILKTQGSDTKLVGQMQPYFEARGLSRTPLAHWSIPPLVTQIADGENGGVMMNEFPPKYLDVTASSSGTETPPVTVSEYLDYLASMGIHEEDFPPVQPVLQNKIWERFQVGSGPEALEKLVRSMEKEDNRFHMEGGSWTSNISWVRGYESLLGPMEQTSAMFAEKMLARKVATSDATYRRALFHLLSSQCSCYRYWGRGVWTDYGRELCRRTMEILQRGE